MARPKIRVEPKVERIELRVSERQAAAIRQAAEETGNTVTTFVVEAAYLEAQRALADRRLFRLGAEAWERFSKALDRPARAPERLRELMRERGTLG